MDFTAEGLFLFTCECHFELSVPSADANGETGTDNASWAVLMRRSECHVTQCAQQRHYQFAELVVVNRKEL
jgi:hypothetical protein